MFKRWIHGILIVSLVLPSACASVGKDENAKVTATEVEKSPTQMQQVQNLKVESLIYTEQQLPLEEFHRQLLHGRFKAAFSKIDLRYKSSSTANDVLKELMSDGFVPVYVRVQNVGSAPIDLAEADFQISNGKSSHKALLAQEVPSKFQRLDGEAIAADVALTTVFVLGIFMIQYVPNSFIHAVDGSTDGGSRSANNWKKTTHIKYGDVLLNPQTLLPGSVAEGLLFFERTSTDDNRDFQLVFTE